MVVATSLVEHAGANAVSDVMPRDLGSESRRAGVPGVLALDGWIEFNCRKWRVAPWPVRIARPGHAVPAVSSVLYRDGRGRLCLPPGNPYVPMWFDATPTTSMARLDRHWLEVAGLLAVEMSGHSFRGPLLLTPGVTDLRPWIWQGFDVGVRYTLIADLPFADETADPAVRRRIKKAHQSGYRCERVASYHDLVTCLHDTEHRQHFALGLTGADMELLEALVGSEHFRCYVCYAPNGEPASARTVLHAPGDVAVGLWAGSATAHLASGATQLLLRYILDDVYAAGATALDFAGANIPSVAASKVDWGARIVPYYSVEAPSVKTLGRFARGWWQSWREQRSARR